jgi:hypothetical protein
MGALDVEAKYKAIYESDADLNLYLDYIQTPTVATLTQPVGSGGAILALTMVASGYHKGKVDTDQHYVQFDGDISGIYNTHGWRRPGRHALQLHHDPVLSR